MSSDFITFPFIRNGITLDNKDAPVCGLTVLSCGSMRFRWNEENILRQTKLTEISQLFDGKTFVPVELNHTKIVYDVKNSDDTKGFVGDGIITLNRNLIPTVTVADCVPIYFFDPITRVFGIVHSGWKGTGIIKEALELAHKNYNAQPQNFCVAIGPHIHECCYIVDSVRAKYFSDNFGTECLKPLEQNVHVDWKFSQSCTEKKLYRLSLAKANLFILQKLGIPKENIFIHEDCTCCSKNSFYGSNRRETLETGKSDCFTAQAAFIVY